MEFIIKVQLKDLSIFIYDNGVLIKLFGITVRKNPSKKELFLQAISKIQGDTRYKTVKYKKCLDDDFNGKI